MQPLIDIKVGADLVETEIGEKSPCISDNSPCARSQLQTFVIVHSDEDGGHPELIEIAG